MANEPFSYKRLKTMSDNDLIQKCDDYGNSTNNIFNMAFWLDELVRRRNDRAAERMDVLMRRTLWIAGVSIILSAISIIVALFK
ncbi:MAG: hypothetical protein ACHQNE_01685 [Candidatus Kapaibacterium sp.]